MSAPAAPPGTAQRTAPGTAWPTLIDDLCLRVGGLVLVTDLAIVALRVLS